MSIYFCCCSCFLVFSSPASLLHVSSQPCVLWGHTPTQNCTLYCMGQTYVWYIWQGTFCNGLVPSRVYKAVASDPVRLQMLSHDPHRPANCKFPTHPFGKKKAVSHALEHFLRARKWIKLKFLCFAWTLIITCFVRSLNNLASLLHFCLLQPVQS